MRALEDGSQWATFGLKQFNRKLSVGELSLDFRVIHLH